MATPRKRTGCLGQLVLLAVFVVALAMGVAAITNPWIFTVAVIFAWARSPALSHRMDR